MTRPLRCTTSVLLCLMSYASFLGLAPSVWAAPASLAQVQTLIGRLTVQRAGASVDAVQGAALFAGDVCRTGPTGRATLFFQDGSQALMNADTVVALTSASDAPLIRGHRMLFHLVHGEVYARLRPGLSVQTNFAVAAVQGTEFDLIADDGDVTRLTVVEGVVAFADAQGAVQVGPSQQSVARPGQPPTAPVTVGVGAALFEWTLSLDRAAVTREEFFRTPDMRAAVAALPASAAGQSADPAARRGYGDALFDARRYAAALVEYRAADRAAPGDAVTLTRIGDALQALGQLDNAEASYQAAQKTDAANPAATAQAASTARADCALPRTGNDYGETPLVGLAWVALRRNQPQAAQNWAEQAVTTDPASTPAQIALGVALLRQPTQQTAARTALTAALTGEPASYHYQADAWLALLSLAQNDSAQALAQAQAATTAAPASALAHATLAQVDFFSNRSAAAVLEARQAISLNESSVPAQVVLGQALLAAGDVGGAAQAGARAVALDPAEAQAWFLLGVADYSRRDFSHAIRELRRASALAPDWAAPAGALGRSLTAIGRQGEADTLLTGLIARLPNSPEVRSAYGQVLYKQGRYQDALDQYRQATRLSPGDAVAWAELARVAQFANNLNEAVNAARTAVQLAPDVAQFHALLGLIYEFANFSDQAFAEFQEALIRDPHNALAIYGLGNNSQSRDARLGTDTETQALLYDPSLRQQILRGGMHTVFNPITDDGHNYVGGLSHYDVVDNGNYNIYTYLSAEDHPGDYSDTDSRTYPHVSQTHVFTPDINDTGYIFAQQTDANGGLQPDDRQTDRSRSIELGFRHSQSSSDLWLGLYGAEDDYTEYNPNGDASLNLESGFATADDYYYNQSRVFEKDILFEPEVRYDITLNRTPEHISQLTFGAAYNRNPTRIDSNLLDPDTSLPAGTDVEKEVDSDTVIYGQWTQAFSSRLKLFAQIRYNTASERDGDTAEIIQPDGSVQTQSGIGTIVVPTGKKWLPSALLTYQADRSTSVRLYASRQDENAVIPTYIPDETLLTSEAIVAPYGDADTENQLELDVARYLNRASYLKFYLYRGEATNVTLDTTTTTSGYDFFYDKLIRTGVGVRYERQLTRTLFVDLFGAPRRTIADVADYPYSGKSAPDQRMLDGGFDFNYIDPRGNKVFLNFAAGGPEYRDSIDDSGDVPVVTRSTDPSYARLNVQYDYEPTVHANYYMGVTNLLNNQTNEEGKRRVYTGVVLRF